MIIDCHGHFTTAPASFRAWRARQGEFANALHRGIQLN
jgi:4-oxalmesaconate hydratase